MKEFDNDGFIPETSVDSLTTIKKAISGLGRNRTVQALSLALAVGVAAVAAPYLNNGASASELDQTAPTRVQGKPLFDECAGAKGPIIDGRPEFTHLATEGGFLRRHPVTLGSRRGILEVGVEGEAFGQHDRAVFVIPEGGHTWTLNVRGGANVITSRLLGFCGGLKEVVNWASSMHIDSLRQASRDWTGQEPTKTEITLGVFNFEGDRATPPYATLTELQQGDMGIEDWARRFDLSFVDTDGTRAGQPIKGVGAPARPRNRGVS